ncbi:MAG: ECF transporter S component [Clostridia bacterium]|nr:ECF transporter S component [Clostridia bacterium]
MNTRKNLYNLVLLGVLAGLIFLMGQTPIGLIPLGFCNVTLLVIPVAVGTIYMGWKHGLVLGAAFAATSLVSALTKPSALVATLMGASPILAIVMTVLPRLCIPLVIWGVYQLLSRKQKHAAAAVAAACGSLTNTVLYLGLMLLFYILCGIDNTKVLTTIAAVAGGAGPLEALAAAIIVPPILTALWKIKKV